MFCLSMFVIALFTSDVGFKHVSCMAVLFMMFHGTHIDFLHFSCRVKLEVTVTVAFILWFSVNFQALWRRRAMGFLWYEIFCFRQAQRFIAFVGLSFCYFTRTCVALPYRTIWALAFSLYPSAILNMFGLIMIETTSKVVSIMLRIIMFQP